MYSNDFILQQITRIFDMHDYSQYKIYCMKRKICLQLYDLKRTNLKQRNMLYPGVRPSDNFGMDKTLQNR